MSAGVSFGSSLVRSGPNSLPTPFELVAGDAAGHLEHLLAVAERPAVVELLDRRGQVVELPLLARAVELEQLVRDRQRVLGQVGLGVGEVLVEVLDDVQRPVHPPPVAGIGADVGIDARLASGAVKLELLRLARLEQPAGEQDLVRAAGRSCRSRAPGLGGRRLGRAGRPLRASPGWVTTKLCGIRSVFSKTISTGLPAWTTSRSLSKSIWSVHACRARITRTPSSPSSLRTCLGLGPAAAAPASASAELQRVERRRRGPVARPGSCGRRRAGRRAAGSASSVGQYGGRDALQGLDRGVPVGVVAGRTGPGP